MSKPRKQSSGFGNPTERQSSKSKSSLNSADQAAKEREAAALVNQGKLQDAEVVYKELIAKDTRNHINYCNLASVYGMRGKVSVCMELLQKSLEINPNFPEAHFNLGNALKDQGKLAAAITSFNKALQLRPNYLEAHLNLGNALNEQGDLTAAIASFNKALQLRPNFPDAHYNLGNALKKQGDLTAAIASFNKALQLRPNFPDAHYNLGNALKKQGDLTAAIASFNKALQLRPNFPEAHYNLGNALKDQGDLTAAIASFNKALQLRPNYPDAHNNLGNALKDQGDLTAAIASFNKALQLRPNYPDAHNNLGNALKDQGDLTAAIASFNKALQLKPNESDTLFNLSLAMLLSGDYKNGWEKYEWRAKQENTISQQHAAPKCTLWDGNVDLNQGNQLLLVSEQGLGDTLQFMRYANALRRKGAKISICAQPKLHSLIQASGIDPSPLTPTQANQVTEGQWIPLLSAPKNLNVTPNNPIITEPYIKTTDQLGAKWASLLKEQARPIIGINWQGNPKAEKTGLRGRSLALERFAPITADSAISLVSLQKGFGSEQLESCSFKDRFVSCQDQINDTWDFLETAAIIANCDLVITSDTSVAHLAGGMGKATWLLLHQVPDWRWGLEGDTTFWYPSMRLFRQKERGNWNEVMQRVAEALQEHFEKSSMHPGAANTVQPSIKPKPIQNILAPISLGELIDKITILQIKTQHLQGNALENVQQELAALELNLNKFQLDIDPSLIHSLKKVNHGLWQIEDAIRDQERQKTFGEDFIHLARSVYQQNDLRSAIKKKINTTYGSAFTEEKSYKQY